MTQQRYQYYNNEGTQALIALEKYLAQCGLEEKLIHLIKMRASQLNGCAYCLDMHSKDARACGDTDQRLHLLNAWREAREFYSAREQAALAWTEALTLIADTHAPDAVYEQVRAEFSEKEIADLTFVIVGINGWNRLAISSRTPSGTYKVQD